MLKKFLYKSKYLPFILYLFNGSFLFGIYLLVEYLIH